MSSHTSNDDMSPSSRNCLNPSKVWAWPWVVHTVSLYAFAILWAVVSIFLRYFAPNGDWGENLPGLDRTMLRKVTMGSHMFFGAIAMLIGPFQLIPRFRKMKRFPLHKWMGRLFVVGGLGAPIFGIVFICVKGKLTGGWNMTAAFATAGVVNFYVVWKAFWHARNKEWQKHRNFALRSYSQLLAPMLYRYWYIALQIFGIYEGPQIASEEGAIVNADDTIDSYFRILDALHCWGYWITALMIAEAVIFFLPPVQGYLGVEEEVSPSPKSAIDTGADNEESKGDEMGKSGGENEIGNDKNLEDGRSEDEDEVLSDSPKQSGSPMAVNAIGIALAIISVAITIKIVMEGASA